MGDKPISSASRWTEADKLKTFFDIIEAAGPIEWSKVPIPEGRTQKAVRSMLDGERTKMRKALEASGATTNGATENGDGSAPAAAPKRKRAPAKKKAANDENGTEAGTGEADGDDQPAAPKRKRAAPKKKEQKVTEIDEGAEDADGKPAAPKRKRAPPKKEVSKNKNSEVNDMLNNH